MLNCNPALSSRSISSTAKVVYMVILFFVMEFGKKCSLSHRYISLASGIDVRSVSRLIGELKLNGYIKVIRGGNKKPNSYIVINNRIEYQQCVKDKINNKDYRLSARNSLKDWYIKGLIKNNTHLSNDEIPDELVELKRKHLLLKRIAKEKYGSKNA